MLAVALGVAIALSVDLANATAVASFASSVNVISNHVNLQVLGVGRGFDERTILRVQNVPGVLYAGPAIEDALTVGARPGDAFSGEILRVLGVDLLRPVPGSARYRDARRRRAGADPWLLVNGHGAFVSARVAAKYRLARRLDHRGLAGDRTVQLRVAGGAPGERRGRRFERRLRRHRDRAGDLRQARPARPHRLHRRSGAAGARRRRDPARAAARRARDRTEVRTGEIARMLRSFQLNLAALSYIALLVGMYLIYNTVAISVVQRRPEIGTLRALGVKRGQIVRTFLGRGRALRRRGLARRARIGSLLATFSVAAVSRTVDTLYVASHADRVIYDPVVLVKAFLIGVAAAIVAALVPALEAAAHAAGDRDARARFRAPAPAVRSARGDLRRGSAAARVGVHVRAAGRRRAGVRLRRRSADHLRRVAVRAARDRRALAARARRARVALGRGRDRGRQPRFVAACATASRLRR